MQTTRGGLASLFTFRRVVSSVLLAGACAGLVVAFIMHEEDPELAARPRQVTSISPEPGTLQLRQTEIFVELDPAYTGTLLINGTSIPEDQLDVIRGLNRLSYTPGAGKELRRLPPGRNCAEVAFEPAVGAGGDTGRYRWCFNVS